MDSSAPRVTATDGFGVSVVPEVRGAQQALKPNVKRVTSVSWNAQKPRLMAARSVQLDMTASLALNILRKCPVLWAITVPTMLPMHTLALLVLTVTICSRPALQIASPATQVRSAVLVKPAKVRHATKATTVHVAQVYTNTPALQEHLAATRLAKGISANVFHAHRVRTALKLQQIQCLPPKATTLLCLECLLSNHSFSVLQSTTAQKKE